MKWETVTSTIGQSVFSLWNNGKQLVTLAFNNFSDAARVEFGNERRVFLIRKEGLFKTTTVLTNEYGIRLGHIGKAGQDHFIELDNERYYYSVNKNENQIRIYRNLVSEEPLAVCELSVENVADRPTATRNFSDKTYYSLLMTLCLYLFNPATRPTF